MIDQRIGRRFSCVSLPRLVRVVAAILCAPPLAAQVPAGPGQTSAAVGQAASRQTAPAPAAYVLGIDDQVLIRVSDVPEIGAAPQRIDVNGDLRLPMVGRIHAAGLTVDELEQALTTKLKTYLTDPHVTVTTEELRNQSVTVLGAVGSAGVKQFRGRPTLIEVLSMAGGPTANAGPTVRVIRRPEEGRIPLPEAAVDATGASTIELDLPRLLGAMTPEKNIVILPNDTVSVPAARLVYILGYVAHAGSVPISHGNSVMITEAIAASGGLTENAAPNHARILRPDDTNTKRREVPVDIQRIMQGRANDVELLAGDILLVPDSTSKKVTRRAIDLVLTVGITIATYSLIRR